MSLPVSGSFSLIREDFSFRSSPASQDLSVFSPVGDFKVTVRSGSAGGACSALGACSAVGDGEPSGSGSAAQAVLPSKVVNCIRRRALMVGKTELNISLLVIGAATRWPVKWPGGIALA